MKQTLIAVLVLIAIIALVLLFARRDNTETPVEENPDTEVATDTLPTELGDDEDSDDDDVATGTDTDVDVDASVDVDAE